MFKVVTHNGPFHADDVFAVAAFQLLFGKENIELVRTRDEDLISGGDYVVDVGGVYNHEQKRYDHHQLGAPVRDNGISYAGFGLMWKHYGEEISGSKEVADSIEKKICMQVDAGDTGTPVSQMNDLKIEQISFDSFIKQWRALDGADENMDEQFNRIVDIVREYLKRKIESEKKRLVDKQYATELYDRTSNKSIIVSDRAISKSIFVDTETEVLIFPEDDTSESKWLAIAIPNSEVGFETKVSFPKNWGGLRDEELEDVSGITGSLFCHKAGFLFVSKTKESAIKAAEMAE